MTHSLLSLQVPLLGQPQDTRCYRAAGGTIGPMGKGQGGSERWGDSGSGASFLRSEMEDRDGQRWKALLRPSRGNLEIPQQLPRHHIPRDPPNPTSLTPS